jgi:DNA-binding MarR family transcriptional regulator
MIQVVPAITGLLDRLEKQNLITRIRGDKDRRAVLVELSEEGEVLLEKLQPEIEALHQSMFSHMETEEMKRLAELLEKVRSAWVAPISARTNNKE